MNEEKSQEKFEDARKEAFEADFEQNCQGRTGPDLSFMKEQAREKPKKKYRVSFGKVAAVVVIVILFSMILSSFAGGGQAEFVIPKVVGMTVEEAMADEEISEKYTI